MSSHDQETNDSFECSDCGGSGPFSKKQLKKARNQQKAICRSCQQDKLQSLPACSCCGGRGPFSRGQRKLRKNGKDAICNECRRAKREANQEPRLPAVTRSKSDPQEHVMLAGSDDEVAVLQDDAEMKEKEDEDHSSEHQEPRLPAVTRSKSDPQEHVMLAGSDDEVAVLQDDVDMKEQEDEDHSTEQQDNTSRAKKPPGKQEILVCFLCGGSDLASKERKRARNGEKAHCRACVDANIDHEGQPLSCLNCGGNGPFTLAQRRYALRGRAVQCIDCNQKPPCCAFCGQTELAKKERNRVRHGGRPFCSTCKSNRKNSMLKCASCDDFADPGRRDKVSDAEWEKYKSGNPAVCSKCEHPNTSEQAVSDANAGKLYFSDGVSVASGDSSSSSSKNHGGNHTRTKANRDFHSKNAAILDSSDDASDDFGEEKEEDFPMEVSLEALKRQVLGPRRQLRSAGGQMDQDDAPHGIPKEKLKGIKNLDDLRGELACAICHECLYEPVSLHCGHSFCKECLRWWLTHSTAAPSTPQPNEAPKHGKCPTCRRALECAGTAIAVNRALRACVMSLFREDIEERIAKEKKAMAGEDDGAHSRGYEVLSDMNEEPWKRIGNGWPVRRSIVLDSHDQTMQLALSLQSEPVYDTDNVLCVDLCLLRMEEDEATDGIGFPLVLNEEDDDDHLVCRHDARFVSHVEAVAQLRGGSESGSPVARQFLGEDGSVIFRIEGQNLSDAQTISFIHSETGAALEMRLPHQRTRLQNSGTSSGANARTGVHAFIEGGAEEEEEEEEPGEYEADDFLVNDDASEKHEDEDPDSESDLCCLCGDGGELLICWGGERLQGCGRAFHIQCVGRFVTPPGDWVCQSCANAAEIEVGLEGHEFAASPEKPAAGLKRKLESLCDTDGSENEFAEPDQKQAVMPHYDDKEPLPPQSKKTTGRIVFEEEDDSYGDDAHVNEDKCDDGGSIEALPPRKKKAKRRLVIGDDEDSE